jgi:alkylated DNA repair dioxygenase AlkB
MKASKEFKKPRIQGGWSAPSVTDKPKPTGEKQPVTSKVRSAVVYKKETGAKKEFEILQEGLVYLPNALDIPTQQWINDVVFETGVGDDKQGGGFYKLEGNALKLNMGKRGRVIEPMAAFPDKLRKMCKKFAEKAKEIDPTMPDMDPNTLLINFYNDNASFKWHRDSEDPQLVKEGKGKPIVSFSIGLSADFCYKTHYEDQAYNTIRLNSGDVLIFGGRSRMIVHQVEKIYPHTMPIDLKMRNGRLSLTFRDVIGFLDETQFPKFRVKYDIEPAP